MWTLLWLFFHCIDIFVSSAEEDIGEVLGKHLRIREVNVSLMLSLEIWFRSWSWWS